MPNESLKHRLSIGPQMSAVAFLWRHLHLNVTWYPGNSSCDSNLCRILWIFFPLVFSWFGPQEGEKLSNPVGGFQEGLTDNLTKVELQMSSLWCPLVVKGTWALWKFCFDLPVVFGNFPVALIWVSSHFSSQWSKCFLSSFHLRVIPQVSLSGLWKLRVELPLFLWSALHSECSSFRTLWSPDSQKFASVVLRGVTDRHAWWLDRYVCVESEADLSPVRLTPP